MSASAMSATSRHLAVIEIRRLFILAFLGQCQDLVAEGAEFGDVAVQRVEQLTCLGQGDELLIGRKRRIACLARLREHGCCAIQLRLVTSAEDERIGALRVQMRQSHFAQRDGTRQAVLADFDDLLADLGDFDPRDRTLYDANADQKCDQQW